MSTTNRLISGSLASWVQIGITIAAQLLLVPIYLSYWDVETYGLWLAVQALLTMLVTLDYGHQNFLGYEFLRLKNTNRTQLDRYLWSGMVMALVIGLFEVGLIAALHFFGGLKLLLGEWSNADTLKNQEAGLVLLMLGIAWFMASSVGGILMRLVTAFHYFPRMAWWGVCTSLLTSVAPAIAVSLGAGLFWTGFVTAAVTVGINILLFMDYILLLRKEQVKFSRPSLAVGWANFLSSIALSGKKVLEDCRNTGVRIILAPLAGAQHLVAFSTIRTGANFAMQGLNTIINPMMPELIRFLHQRDQERSETAFSSIWLIVAGLMAPGVLILQAVVEPLFEWWTKGKVPFNPALFAVLSLSVLYYALAQPAIAVAAGNNLLKTQLKLSILAALIVVGGMLLLVPRLDILGAGWTLLAAECCVAHGYRHSATKWLRQNGLSWPKASAFCVEKSIWICGLAMAVMIFLPQWKYLALAGGLALLYFNFSRYWQTLPAFTRHRTRGLVLKLKIKS